MSAADWAVLLVAATAAGWVDAVVGGGGLILLPALFLVAPQLTPLAALATNTLQSVWAATRSAEAAAGSARVAATE